MEELYSILRFTRVVPCGQSECVTVCSGITPYQHQEVTT